MKKNFFWSLLAVVLAASLSVSLSSCDDGGDKDPDKVSVSEPTVQFDKKGGQKFISITSNTNWTITGAATWLTILPQSGNKDGVITLSASENNDNQTRNCVLTVKAGDDSKSIIVTQLSSGGSGGALADQVAGTYSGRLKLGEEIIEDAYIIKIIKQTDTTVTVDAPFFGGETYNFNLSQNGNQIQFSNATIQNFSMFFMGNQVTISYLSGSGNMLTYTGTK